MNPATLGFLRAIGTVVLMSVLTYLGDASHLNGILSATLATVISAFALAIEHSIAATTGTALFGAVTVRK